MAPIIGRPIIGQSIIDAPLMVLLQAGGGQDQLIEALEAARLRAQREKHEKWLQKLEAGNHDTSKLRANFESMYAVWLSSS